MNIPILLDDGANIKAWDPVAVENYKKFYPNEITYCDTIEETLKDADICFIFTEWQEIKDLPAETYKKLMKKAIILDGRNCYEPKKFEGTGVVYDSVGRSVVQ